MSHGTPADQTDPEPGAEKAAKPATTGYSTARLMATTDNAFGVRLAKMGRPTSSGRLDAAMSKPQARHWP
ncbi:hypothetical protein ColTof4_01781 [Colletotrichum tofieldiae]|nr:hypothetical protein ColTof3_09935 [Colletotrichum tofieldiae]GKT69358.1 hypothetical protein ColTof4_01781 [Colletotrichum tofieldiae]